MNNYERAVLAANRKRHTGRPRPAVVAAAAERVVAAGEKRAIVAQNAPPEPPKPGEPQ